MKPKEKIELEIELENTRHKNKITEILTEKRSRMEIENLRFDHEMQLQRIKSAEIRKSHERKVLDNLRR